MLNRAPEQSLAAIVWISALTKGATGRSVAAFWTAAGHAGQYDVDALTWFLPLFGHRVRSAGGRGFPPCYVRRRNQAEDIAVRVLEPSGLHGPGDVDIALASHRAY